MTTPPPGDPTLSFVVPAFNEAEYIGKVVRAIKAHVPPGERYEIVVVDNGSTDATASLAAAEGARVLPSKARTIAAVRNEGVRSTRGSTLVLLDGDCLLTEEWAAEFPAVVAEVRATPLALAGSHPVPPADEHVFLWKHWFIPFFQHEDTSHIGSAHMICTRATFDRVNGFDERLVTGEDFDFCTRVRAAGGRVLVKLRMRVEHHGFPRTLGHFLRRERWHGRGDVSSLGAFLGSRVAVLSAAFAVALTAAVVLSLTGAWAWALGAVSAALAINLAAAAARFRHAGPRAMLIATGLFSVYFLGRALSVVDALRRRR